MEIKMDNINKIINLTTEYIDQISSDGRVTGGLIKFINKNIEIISKDTALKEESPIKISTQVYSGKNNIEIERLNGLNCTETELLKEIEESYQNGKISANDITHLDLVKRKELKIKQ